MSALYSLIDTLLPFEWTEFSYMKNAFLAVLLITPLFGLVGTMVVNNKMSFFSDARPFGLDRDCHRCAAWGGQLPALYVGVCASVCPMYISCYEFRNLVCRYNHRRFFQHRPCVRRRAAFCNRRLRKILQLFDRGYFDRTAV